MLPYPPYFCTSREEATRKTPSTEGRDLAQKYAVIIVDVGGSDSRR
jgi:hypothetical protein